ncbi:MAG: SemiSWEET family transporter [Actinomycetota bacterium]
MLASSAAHTATSLPVLAQVFGWTAGSVGISVGWPQAWRLWVGRRHAGLSLSSNVLTVLYSMAWLLYGVASHHFVQIVTCAVGFGVATAVLVGHVRLSRPGTRSWLPLLALSSVLVFALFAAGRKPLGVAASLATISGVVPQVISLVSDRRRGVHSVGGVSIARWVLSVICNVLWCGYGLLVHDALIAVNSTIIGVLCAAIVVLTASSARIELLTTEAAEELSAAALSCAPR